MSLRWVGGLMVAVLMSATGIAGEAYDPLRLPGKPQVESVTFDVHDAGRDRKIPIRVYRVSKVENAPVVMFSHGLGGSRDMSRYLGEHWAARGYVAVFLQHPGSDDKVWREAGIGKRMDAMRDAASAENLLLRVGDVPAVLDQLEKWTNEKSHTLHNVMSCKRVGMSGHSFGAQTTQAVAGQKLPLARQELADSRIVAAVVMSPGSPPIGAARSFAGVTVPWLLMTGTQDTSPIGGQTVETRLAVFPALPAGDKYEIVLDQARHSVFTDREVPGEKRNPNHHRIILALSTAFWDTYIKNDAAAKDWLKGPKAKELLEAADRWQMK